MKKFILFLCFFIAVQGVAKAQWQLSLVAGPSLANFSGADKKIWGGANSDPKMVLRFQLGLTAERLISEKWYVGVGLQFSAKGTMYKGTTDYYNQQTNMLEKISIKYNKMLSYIDIPLYVKYRASSKLNLVGGLQPGLLLSAKIINDENAQKAFSLPKKEDAKDYYRFLDLALLIGPHYQINGKLSARLLFKPGILNIAKGEEYDIGGGTKEKYYKVRNSILEFSFLYILKE